MRLKMYELATYQRNNNVGVEVYCEECFVNLTGEWYRLVKEQIYCASCAYTLFDESRGLKKL